MKKIIYISILFIATIFAACKKDNIGAMIKSKIDAPALTLPTDATDIIIKGPDTTNVFHVKWNKSNFGVPAVISYIVQIDSAGKGFSSAYNLGNTDADSLSITLGRLNNVIINKLNLPSNAKSYLEMRIIASLGDSNKVISQPIKISVTTFKYIEVAPDKLFVPGGYQNWKPDLAPNIRFVANSKYEGYVYMGTADYYKFTSSPDWNHINYGDGGAGKLTTDGKAGGLKVNSSGYYKFGVDTKNLTYTADLIQSFGLIGSATAGGWNNSTDMVYDQANDVWKVTANLVSGALKFRANNTWDINYGPADINSLTGTLIQTNDAITITQNGSYTITIDFKQSTSNKYLYTVVKN